MSVIRLAAATLAAVIATAAATATASRPATPAQRAAVTRAFQGRHFPVADGSEYTCPVAGVPAGVADDLISYLRC